MIKYLFIFYFSLFAFSAHGATQDNEYIARLFDNKYSSFHTSNSHIIEKVYLSAEGGDAESQYSIGILKIRGDRVERNIIDGCAWLVVSLKNGHSLAKEPASIIYNSLSGNDKRLVKARAQEISSNVLPPPPPDPLQLMRIRAAMEEKREPEIVDPVELAIRMEKKAQMRMRLERNQQMLQANQLQLQLQRQSSQLQSQALQQQRQLRSQAFQQRENAHRIKLELSDLNSNMRQLNNNIGW